MPVPVLEKACASCLRGVTFRAVSKPLVIHNDGPKIVSTNFWTELDRGKFLVSVNAQCFRVLTPRRKESAIGKMVTGREVIVSRGPWPQEGFTDAVEFMFTGGSASPYALYLDAESFDVLPSGADEARTDLECVVYRGDAQGRPAVALRRPARYRRVPQLPCLRPWEEMS